MSDELDKFVLSYSVEMRDAISRLEQLNQKIEHTGKTSSKTAGEIKDFAVGATDEIGKLIPGIDKVSAAIKALGAEFAVAGLAVGALAVGVKSVIDMREQYNQQRKQGMDVGVSALRLEEYQRKFAKTSGGNITREQTAEEVKKLAEFSSAVYRDPTKIGTEARTARRLGINMGAPGQHMGVNALLTQLGEKFSKMSDAQVQAAAKTMNMNQDFALSLKKQGASVGTVTELTAGEISSREAAQDRLSKFNEAMVQLGENFKKAENILGEKLLPAFTTFIQLMVDLTGAIPTHLPEIKKATLAAVPGAGTISTAMDIYDWAKGKITGKKEAPEPADDVAKATTAAKTAATSSAETAKTNAATAKNINTSIEEQDRVNEDAQRAADENALAINQFAGAVASFANAVDEKQAWAAWAGEVGKAAGLSPTSTAARTPPEQREEARAGKAEVPLSIPEANRVAGPQVGATKYDETFEAAGKKYGVDPNLLKNIARVESGFNPNAVSGAGATGLMQIMPSNFKSLNITDAKDATQNIMGAANLFSQFLKKAKGDVELALRYYNGGFDRSKWGPQNEAYAAKVLGGRSAEGQSKSSLNLTAVQNTIAQRLGVSVKQLQQGGIRRGDVAFASSQLEAGIQNQIFDLKNQLMAQNLPQQTRSKLMTELKSQESGLAKMRQYSAQVIERSKEGDRSITVGERAVVINVNGAANPTETAKHIQAQLQDHFGEIVNGTTTAMKL